MRKARSTIGFLRVSPLIRPSRARYPEADLVIDGQSKNRTDVALSAVPRKAYSFSVTHRRSLDTAAGMQSLPSSSRRTPSARRCRCSALVIPIAWQKQKFQATLTMSLPEVRSRSLQIDRCVELMRRGLSARLVCGTLNHLMMRCR